MHARRPHFHHLASARRRLDRQETPVPGPREAVMEPARPDRVANAGDRVVEPHAVEHRAAHQVARHPDCPILRPDVVDGLDQAGAIDGKGVAGDQAGRVEAHEARTLVGPDVDHAAVAVQLQFVVFVVGDERRAAFPLRNRHRGATGGAPAARPAARLRQVAPAVPQEHRLERDAGAVRDTLDLAHVPRPGGPGRGFEGAEAFRASPLAHERPEPADGGNDVPQCGRRRLAESAADRMGVAMCRQGGEVRAAHGPAFSSIRARSACASASSWALSPSSNHWSDASMASPASAFLPARTHNGARSSTTRSSCMRAV